MTRSHDDIIKRAKAGDRVALTELIDKHKHFTYSLALSIVKNSDDAKDIAQQSFMKVLESIHTFRNDSKFSTWLYKIILHEALRFVKQKSRVVYTGINQTPVEEIVGENPGDENEPANVTQALEILQVNEKIVLNLFYLGGKSIKEIQLITGFSESNIKVLLHRGRTRLKNKMRNRI